MEGHSDLASRPRSLAQVYARLAGARLLRDGLSGLEGIEDVNVQIGDLGDIACH